jgi:hypothetical protein
VAGVDWEASAGLPRNSLDFAVEGFDWEGLAGLPRNFVSTARWSQMSRVVLSHLLRYSAGYLVPAVVLGS